MVAQDSKLEWLLQKWKALKMGALDQLGKVKGQQILKPDGIFSGLWKGNCLKWLKYDLEHPGLP